MTAAAATPHVYQAIAQVMAKLAKDGITKARKNDQQGYSFRGIDDVYNALAPILADVGLCILPQVKRREVVERQTQRGSTLFYVNVDVDYSFVSAKDGSAHTVSTCGEAMDSADKATNKAMSAAYKYACIQAFCIPTEGDNDADATTHAVAPKAKPTNPVKTVSDDEISTITKLSELAGVPLETICQKYGVPVINDLPLAKAGEVIARLQEVAKQKATKE